MEEEQEECRLDQNLRTVVEKRIERTVTALNKNGFDACFVKTTEDLFEAVDRYLPKGATCSLGGSMTLNETGIRQYIENGDYIYYDRHAPDADEMEVFRKALTCDVYFMSSNAILEDGRLYNIDGRGNRVAALTFGPKKVVVVAGYNKIVSGPEQARLRLRETAAPANAVRLGRTTPCAKTGVCMDCESDDRVCCSEVLTARQFFRNRVSVLILPGHYGY